MKKSTTATTTTLVHIIARIVFKTDARKVCYLVRSSNGKDQYTTCLFNGKACSCTCPSKVFCKHQRAAEQAEASRTPAQVVEVAPVVAQAQEVAASYSSSEQRRNAPLNDNRSFSLMR